MYGEEVVQVCAVFVTAPVAQPPPIFAELICWSGLDWPTPFEAPDSQTSFPRTSSDTGSAAFVSEMLAWFLKHRFPSV
ncbi:MAG: hypothetical protein E6G64_03160 [Actinobacteria bacterium]|nr:MAG: hypothetical protein E6G64_03160 [Actinomycetota bacterium]